MAAVNVVFPWSTCPIVPMFTCGLLRSNFSLLILVSLPQSYVFSIPKNFLICLATCSSTSECLGTGCFRPFVGFAQLSCRDPCLNKTQPAFPTALSGLSVSYQDFFDLIFIRNLIHRHQEVRILDVLFQFLDRFPLGHYFRVFEQLAQPEPVRLPIDHSHLGCCLP